ncbi:hypothetical protein D9M68_510410 [compost metagenome]
MSTSSAKPGSAPKADPLSILKCWERGELDARAIPERNEQALSHDQKRRLWSLLQNPSLPGLISFPLPR